MFLAKVVLKGEVVAGSNFCRSPLQISSLYQANVLLSGSQLIDAGLKQIVLTGPSANRSEQFLCLYKFALLRHQRRF